MVAACKTKATGAFRQTPFPSSTNDPFLAETALICGSVQNLLLRILKYPAHSQAFCAPMCDLGSNGSGRRRSKDTALMNTILFASLFFLLANCITLATW